MPQPRLIHSQCLSNGNIVFCLITLRPCLYN